MKRYYELHRNYDRLGSVIIEGCLDIEQKFERI